MGLEDLENLSENPDGNIYYLYKLGGKYFKYNYDKYDISYECTFSESESLCDNGYLKAVILPEGVVDMMYGNIGCLIYGTGETSCYY